MAAVAQQLSLWEKQISMKGKYIAAAIVAVAGITLYYFFGRKKTPVATQPQKENERHHLTNAFAKAKQVAVGK